ncbi:DUF2799 domain-containing protein [Pleionea litopenaei]|uniref:DUF2799 domain-containing protein n=1 Tax=Pleionea litopenaei TaxID=3070815 RepID=A0AA51RR31_9GAMM|nr:DUF2799 domain-containing protein [Pleionea sp. HL-JVS1]WMS85978.1 DUF2799 domain-containing protein [Pleionea sp. HL-JVS1]
MKSLIAVFTFLALPGCSSWVANPVHVTDWYKVGVQEGKAGYTLSWRQNYHKVRGKTPESFNLDQYKLGFKEGRETYCSVSLCNHPHNSIVEND